MAMRYTTTMDGRHTVPPLLNLLFFFFPHIYNFKLGARYEHYLLPSSFFLIFLFMSVKFNLNFLISATMDPIRLGYKELFRVSVIMEPVRFGYTEFSVPVTTSLLASIFLPLLHFWIAFPIIICLSGWVDVIWNQLKATTVAIIWTTHQEVQPETEPAAAQFQMVAIVGDEHSQQEQSTLDGDILIGIDEQP